MYLKTILYISGLVLAVATVASGAAHDVSNISFDANSTAGKHIESTYSAKGGFLVVTDGTTYEYVPGALKIYQVVGSQKRLMATAVFDQNDLFEKSVGTDDRALFWSERLNAGIGADSACVLAAKGDVTVKVTGNFVPRMLADGESLFAVDAGSSIRISNNWKCRVKVANAAELHWSVSYELTENRTLFISIGSISSGMGTVASSSASQTASSSTNETTGGSIGGTTSGSIGEPASVSGGGTASGSGGGSARGTASGTSSGSSGSAEDVSTGTSSADSQMPTDKDTHISGGGGTAGDFEQGTSLESKLASLKSLPKTHYSWGLYYYQLLGDPNDSRFYHLARITHAFCVAGAYIGPHQIDIAVYNCAKSNKTNPGTAASIGVNFSPYHYRFGRDLPPTDRGPTYQAELAYLTERINLVKEWVRASNLKYDSDVRISAILLDSERFLVKSGDEAWNTGIAEALDAVHRLVQQLMPGVRIEWYGRGMNLECATWTPTGYQGGIWLQTEYFTGNERYIPSLSCSLYTLPDEHNTRPRLIQTCELAKKMNIHDVTPWVALAAGYKPNIALGKNVWDDDWDFDLTLSHQLGKDLNSNQPPYDYVKVVSFFPAPFYTNTPGWTKHFIAYVRGANGVDDLSDLELSE